MTRPVGSSRPFISSPSPQEGALRQQEGALSGPPLKRERSASASSGTPSTEKPPLKKQKNSAVAVLNMVARRRSSSSPASAASPRIQANPDVNDNTSPPNKEKEENFHKKVEHYREELRRRETDALSSPHSRLAAAVVTMFEFDEPEMRAIKEAVISSLRDGAISQDQFFSKANGETVTPFDDILETIGSKFRGSGAASGEDRLIKDVQTFLDLMGACHASTVKKIRAAPSSCLAKAATTFVREALAVTPKQEVADAEMLQTLDALGTKPDAGAVLDLLGRACAERRFSAKIRMAFHGLGLAFAALLPDSASKAVLIGEFAGNVPHLPLEHQLHAFRNCISLGTDAPADTARLLFESCAWHLNKFDHEVGGKAAIELVKAAAQYGDPEALRNVLNGIEHLILRNPSANSGKSYFDSVPENDRIEYFVSAVHADLHLPYFDDYPGSIRGERIVSLGGLPDRMTTPAKKALERIGRGEEIDLRAEIQRW